MYGRVMQASTEDNETIRVTCGQSDWAKGLGSSCKWNSENGVAYTNETISITCDQSDWATGLGSPCQLVTC